MKKTYIKPATTLFAFNVQNNLLTGSLDPNNGNFSVTNVDEDNTGMTGWSRRNNVWDDEE